MREIGGYLEFEKFHSGEYYPELIALNTGRNALLYLIKAKNIQKIYIPFYLCNSVGDTLDKYCVEYEYYRIGKNFVPEFSKTLDEREYIYVVNYFGQLLNGTISNLYVKYNNIIIDNSHAFFQRPIENIPTIYTCRKFFGVPDGAYLYSDNLLDANLAVDRSGERISHLIGRFEGVATEYYRQFKENEELLANIPLRYMSKLTRNLLSAIDYDRVCRVREENYLHLDKELGKYNRLDLRAPIGPFMYPFYIENGQDIRATLNRSGVYVPTLWPEVLNLLEDDGVEIDYVSNVLPLACDQRYGIDDMNYTIEKVKSLFEVCS